MQFDNGNSSSSIIIHRQREEELKGLMYQSNTVGGWRYCSDVCSDVSTVKKIHNTQKEVRIEKCIHLRTHCRLPEGYDLLLQEIRERLWLIAQPGVSVPCNKRLSLGGDGTHIDITGSKRCPHMKTKRLHFHPLQFARPACDQPNLP